MRIFYDIDLPDDEGGGGGGSNASAAKPATGGGPLVTTKPTTAAPNNPNAALTPARIPLPNYDDPKSRLQYAQNWTKKYGPLMQGRGDTPLRINETPQFGTSTAKNMSLAAAKGVGLDPALLYSSAMEEGLSGNFADANGEFKYERSGQSDKFPVNSSSDFGLDQVRSEISRFQKKGYLPADFQSHYTNAKPKLDENGKLAIDPSTKKPYTQNDVDLDSPESAMKLKAAYLKDNYDDIDSYAKQRGIALSPKARDFFALVNYNGGAGTGHQMLNDYYNNGHLEGDKFLQARPTTGKGLKADSYKTVYENVARRVQMQDALKKEGLFGN